MNLFRQNTPVLTTDIIRQMETYHVYEEWNILMSSPLLVIRFIKPSAILYTLVTN
jgi:hypothetical protein